MFEDGTDSFLLSSDGKLFQITAGGHLNQPYPNTLILSLIFGSVNGYLMPDLR